jgi:two-component system, OmpR family, phosphate regulon response regulator PhoB
MFEKLPPRILVVESDEVARTALCNMIERYWFSVVRADASGSAIEELVQGMPNVAIISSKISFVEVEKLISNIHDRARGIDVPIVILLDDGEDKNAYGPLLGPLVELIYRPFTPNELMICIKSLLRKSNPVFQDKIIKYKDLSMDLATYRVQRGSKNIHLGPTEFKIMQMLLQSPRTILSRQHIIDNVWGRGKEIEPRTVDVHVNRIRSLVKLRDDEPPLIKTVRSGGYCLNLPGERD